MSNGVLLVDIIYLLIIKGLLFANFSRYSGKANFGVQTNFNPNTELIALFEFGVSSLFFDVKKVDNAVKSPQ